jgi:hypothetical protein
VSTARPTTRDRSSAWVGQLCGWAIAGLGTLLLLLGALTASPFTESLGLRLAMLPWVGVGAFVVATRPRNPVGWLFSAVGLLWLSGDLVYEWALGASSTDPLLPWASLVSDSYWIPGLGLLLVAVMLFPAGSLPTPRWRPAFALVVGGLVLAIARAAFATSVQAGERGPIVDNPIGLSAVGFVSSSDEEPILLYLLAAAITALTSFVVRFRRSTGTERQQLKWMALAVPAMVAGWVLAGFLEPWKVLADLLRSSSMALTPIAAGLAIARFRLYDVDRVILRTTAYAMVTGVVLGVYGVVVTSATRLLPSSSQLAVAGATLCAAAVFRPVLRWALRVVDRRFNRRHYDAERAVAAFADQLRDQVATDQVVAGLIDTVDRTVEPVAVALWRPKVHRTFTDS